MARWIDADLLIAELNDDIKECEPLREGNDIAYGIMLGSKNAIAFAEALATVDAVEVVRCKDCKHGELDEAERDDYYLCHHHGCDWNDGYHFCSYGERKEKQ